jgi:fibronectin type 3 domain-containing protein
VYRSADGQPPARLGELVTTPAYSDRVVQSGKRYRYEVTAVDQKGNESARSAPVEATAP